MVVDVGLRVDVVEDLLHCGVDNASGVIWFHIKSEGRNFIVSFRVGVLKPYLSESLFN